MIPFHVRAAAAWSPGIETAEQWAKWALEPRPLEREGRPELPFLPPLLRRRCDQLGRMMLWVVHACCPAELLGEVNTVFASRHGAFGTMVGMLDELAQQRALSPAAFSHSVHNTQAALFSIWARNQQLSTSVAAGAATFGHGLLEALGILQREPERAVLYVCGDEAIPEPVRGICDHDQGAYALALLLAAQGHAAPLGFALAAPQDAPPLAHPDALEFLRWLHAGDRKGRKDGGEEGCEELCLGRAGCGFRFVRAVTPEGDGTPGSC